MLIHLATEDQGRRLTLHQEHLSGKLDGGREFALTSGAGCGSPYIFFRLGPEKEGSPHINELVDARGLITEWVERRLLWEKPRKEQEAELLKDCQAAFVREQGEATTVKETEDGVEVSIANFADVRDCEAIAKLNAKYDLQNTKIYPGDETNDVVIVFKF